MGSTIEVRAPAEQSEGTRSLVQHWLKGVGDVVRVDEPLLELETDKVTVEIAAPASGRLLSIVKPEQADVAPGEHTVRVVNPGTGFEATRQVKIQSGKTEKVFIPVE